MTDRRADSLGNDFPVGRLKCLDVRTTDRSLMKRVLIVKVTSLGDIVQALPVVADIKRAFPGVQVDWAADEAFAELVHWSKGVDRVLYAPLTLSLQWTNSAKASSA